MRFSSAIITLSILAMFLPVVAGRLGGYEGSLFVLDNKDDNKDNNDLPQLDPLYLSSADPRIIGGTNSQPNVFPFFVGWLGCGASLIHKDIVMTAAHCAPIQENAVYVGAFRAQSTDSGAEAKTLILRRPHPSFNANTLVNDVMLMKINTPSTKAPVGLAGPGDPSSGDSFIAIGHGVISTSTGQASNTLQQVTVPYVTDSQCQSLYSSFIYKVVPNVMMCAGSEGLDACQGDSGGPLLQKLSNGNYVQHGITSWGDGCAKRNAPGVYSQVNAFSTWIDQQICDMSDDPPSSCPPRSNPGDIPVRVDITFDRYPGENSWSISRNGNVVVSRSRFDCSFQWGFTSERVYLAPGEYTFTMNDSYADGINCGSGEGKIDIYAELTSGDVRVFTSNGQFAGSISGTLNVSQGSTSVSTASDPGCPSGAASGLGKPGVGGLEGLFGGLEGRFP